VNKQSPALQLLSYCWFYKILLDGVVIPLQMGTQGNCPNFSPPLHYQSSYADGLSRKRQGIYSLLPLKSGRYSVLAISLLYPQEGTPVAIPHEQRLLMNFIK